METHKGHSALTPNHDQSTPAMRRTDPEEAQHFVSNPGTEAPGAGGAEGFHIHTTHDRSAAPSRASPSRSPDSAGSGRPHAGDREPHWSGPGDADGRGHCDQSRPPDATHDRAARTRPD